MSKYLCLKCDEVYDEDLIALREYGDGFSRYRECPKSSCNGMVIEVDEVILPTIRVLNQKGYITLFCCSGHFNMGVSNIYIKFEEECFDAIINSDLPEDFEIEDGDVIRYTPSEIYSAERKFEFILQKNIELLQWATSLEIIEYKEDV